MERGRPRISLLARVGALSLLVIVLLGLSLGVLMQGVVQRRALETAEQTAQALVLTGVRQHVRVSDLTRGMDERRQRRFVDMLRQEHVSDLGVRRVKLFNGDARVVFSDRPAQIGTSAARSENIQRALAGDVASEFVAGLEHSGHGEPMLEVFIPFREGGRVLGAFEVYLSYAAAAEGERRDTRLLYAALLGGLLLLWGALFRVVSRASHTLRRQARDSHHQARHDALTGLGNRTGLQEPAERVLQAMDDTQLAGLLLIDLDQFKEVNDTLGHHHGDLLLQQVAELLRGCTAPGEVLARLGGDEFACFVPEAGSVEELVTRAERIRTLLAAPIQLAALSVRIDASVGIAVRPDHGLTLEDLLKHADVAMYSAKDTPERVRLYAPDLDPYTEERLLLAGQLQDAIEGGQLVVHYQPIVSAAGGELHAVEALVRWQHPELGLLPPGEFIALAERTGTIGALTRFVIEESVRQAYAWQQRGLDLEVACNLAGASATDMQLPDVVAQALARWPLQPDRLTLELSEDMVITDPGRVGQVLARLGALGIRLALDDFGTGQSSLAHMQRLPLTQLKIDRAFVRALERGGNADVIAAMLALARSFGLETVAEGVEDAATAASLRDLGCDRLQGFHFSRPVPAADLERLLRSSAPAPRASTLFPVP